MCECAGECINLLYVTFYVFCPYASVRFDVCVFECVCMFVMLDVEDLMCVYSCVNAYMRFEARACVCVCVCVCVIFDIWE